MGPVIESDAYLRAFEAFMRGKQAAANSKPASPPDPFAKFDDVDLMMELIKRGYAVHLPLENADKLK